VQVVSVARACRQVQPVPQAWLAQSPSAQSASVSASLSKQS
jgi:hypothetical protein